MKNITITSLTESLLSLRDVVEVAIKDEQSNFCIGSIIEINTHSSANPHKHYMIIGSAFRNGKWTHKRRMKYEEIRHIILHSSNGEKLYLFPDPNSQPKKKLQSLL